MSYIDTFVDPRPVVVITGCSSGLGRAMAIDFEATCKYRIFATARKLESLQELPPGIERVQLDVTDPISIQKAINNITNCTNHRIDILINNAGANSAVGALIEVDVERIRKTFEPNFFGLIQVTQAVAPFMIKRRSGTIVNIGSTAAIATMPFGATYSASKAAVHALSDALRLELAGFGIKVVVVAPGAIQSLIAETGSKEISIPTDSFYKDVEDLILYRANYSQQGHPTPSQVFAQNVRTAITVTNPKPYLFTGKMSWPVWVMSFLPIWIKDWVLGNMFQVWRIGQSSVSKRKSE